MNIKKEDVKSELERILDFWIGLKDDENGGFYCRVDYNLNVDRKAPKSGIAAARNLWSFSRAYRVLEDARYRDCAEHALKFLLENLIDEEFGGAFWHLDCTGAVTDTRKHVYLQAFCIYALSEYYLAFNDQPALSAAVKLWRLLEEKGYESERGCYSEEFSRDWHKIDNELLSENGIIAEITTNTHLHVLEAYTVLYAAKPDDEIKDSLIKVLEIFRTRIYSAEGKYQKVFFDGEWNEAIDLKSYGHDIEASWLIDEAQKALSSEGLEKTEYDNIVTALAEQTLTAAVEPDGSMVNECESGRTDFARIWWVQAEAAVGFYNAWQKTRRQEFLTAFENIWAYISDKIVDRRPGGEWLYGRSPEGRALERDVAEPWKTPYHNSRCCMELLQRMQGIK